MSIPHLPECGNEADCICDRLRACEQRVHDHYSNLAPVGFLLGVQAARDAVAALIAYEVTKDGHLILRGEAEAAINALRGNYNA